VKDEQARRVLVHNQPVSPGLWRAIVALSLVPWLVGSSAMPREHVHEADADHPHSLVHRHLEAHQFESQDHDGAELAHHEDHVVWLSDARIIQNTYQFSVSWAVVGRSLEAISDTASWFRTVSHDGAPPHGPPRPCRSPRAPPHISA
jgi:hypothetical protein